MRKSTGQKSARPPVIIGNWKMYKTVTESLHFIETLAALIEGSQVTVGLAVPFTAIRQMVERTEHSQWPLVIGAQNMNDASEGAFTGEIAAQMLKEAGAQFVLLGHSERRHLFKETSAFINRKIKRALLEGLRPIVCVGETAEERAAGKTESLLKEQLWESLEGLSKTELNQVGIAYEPVWAIGTGKVAQPEEIQAAHQFCRLQIAEIGSESVAEKMVIQYGGSVTEENAQQLLKISHVDGLLVGGASLSAERFSKIIRAAAPPAPAKSSRRRSASSKVE